MSATGESLQSSHNDQIDHEPSKSDAAPDSVMPRQTNTVSPTTSMSTDQKTVFIYVPSNAVGIIIGHQNKNIRRISKCTGASLVFCSEIKNCPKELGHVFIQQEWRKFKITGPIFAVQHVQNIIFAQVNNFFCVCDPMFYGYIELIVQITVSNNMVKHIIGRNGWMVSKLEITTGSRIVVQKYDIIKPNPTVPVYIIGDFQSTQMAQKKIHRLLQKIQKTMVNNGE